MTGTLVRWLLYGAAILSLVLCFALAAALGASYWRGCAVLGGRSWVEDWSRPGAVRTDNIILGQAVWIKVYVVHGGFYAGYGQRPGQHGGGPDRLIARNELRFEPLMPSKYPIALGQASFLGFAWEGPGAGQNELGVTVPLWFLVIVTAGLPAAALRVHRRRRAMRWQALGLCGGCGYDLRGSPAGGACPECGARREGVRGESDDKAAAGPV